MKMSTLACNAAINAAAALIDAHGVGSLNIFSGTAPTNTTDVDSGVLLATCPMSATAFAAAVGGTATANAITSDLSIDATGTAGYFRIKDGLGAVIAQGTVGTSATDMVVNTTAFVMGDTCAISSLTWTQPPGT